VTASPDSARKPELLEAISSNPPRGQRRDPTGGSLNPSESETGSCRPPAAGELVLESEHVRRFCEEEEGMEGRVSVFFLLA
jgi:hypothetical protein